MKIKHLYLLLILLIAFSFKQKEEKPTSISYSTVEVEIAKESTAQPNVIILDKQFEMPGLDRNRQIRIYLPPNYKKSDKKYPVLYMHDAQNLFDDATAYSGEWGVDESLNELAKASGPELIVVGIDNGGEKRMNELSPWENKEFGKAEGKEYMEFIVNQIKPYIDTTYRTLSDRDNTAIMGSSMGGLISHYAIHKYPAVFGKAGIFSPSFWYSKKVYSFTKDNPAPKDSRLFFVVGKKEGTMVPMAKKMYNQIVSSKHPSDNIIITIDPEGIHSEGSWKKQFTPAIQWLFK